MGRHARMWVTVIALQLVAAASLLAAACGQPVATEQTTTISAPPETSTTSTSHETSTTVAAAAGLANEYEVYSALIRAMFPNARLIVIQDKAPVPEQTWMPPSEMARAIRSAWPELGQDIVKDFEDKNETPLTLERRFTLEMDYRFISREELETIFGTTADWDAFYAKYAGSQGVLALSRVGFNEAMDIAVVYAGNQSQGLAGEGNVVLMKKTDGRWTIEGERMMWIS